MGQSFNADPGVTYVRPRTLIIGFVLYCVGFLGLLFGADRITESYESREQIGGALAPSTASPAAPARPAGTAVAPGARAHAAASTALCAPVPPCPAPKPKSKLAVPAARPKAAAPAAQQPLPLPVRAVPAPPAAVRTAVPPSVPSRTVPSGPSRTAPPSAAPAPARAVHTPAALLVPFTNASGLTSSGGLDPRSAAHAPLVVGPTSGLGANPAATPFGGSANPNPR
jgi:DNA polymerase-3 subunit gamma/tau